MSMRSPAKRMELLLAGADDVVGRIVALILKALLIVVDEIEQALKTNGRARKGREIEVPHSHILH